MKLLALFLAAVLPALSAAHSWIVCTDYLENNGWYWDQAKCRGWPRGATAYNLRYGVFGDQNGYTHLLSDNPDEKPLCKVRRGVSWGYLDDTPMAAYYLGQKVVLTHPANNHVAAPRPCGWGPDNPDLENLIFVVNGDEDPCCIDSNKLIQIFDMGVSPYGSDLPNEVLTTYPKPGYQNAPKFCEDPENAMATYNFTVPTILRPGRHTFVWKWLRTPTENSYVSCWEADVFATKAERDAHYLATGRTTEDMWDFYQIHNIVDGVIMDQVDPSGNDVITG